MRGTGQRRGRGGVRGQRRRACLLSAFRGQRRQLVLGNANPAGNRELTRAVGNPDACRLPITNLPRGSQIFAKPTFLQLTSSKRVGMACHPRCIRAPAAWHRPKTTAMSCTMWPAPVSIASIAILWPSSSPRSTFGLKPSSLAKPLGFLDANIRCGDSLLGVYDLEVLPRCAEASLMPPTSRSPAMTR